MTCFQVKTCFLICKSCFLGGVGGWVGMVDKQTGLLCLTASAFDNNLRLPFPLPLFWAGPRPSFDEAVKAWNNSKCPPNKQKLSLEGWKEGITVKDFTNRKADGSVLGFQMELGSLFVRAVTIANDPTTRKHTLMLRQRLNNFFHAVRREEFPNLWTLHLLAFYLGVSFMCLSRALAPRLHLSESFWQECTACHHKSAHRCESRRPTVHAEVAEARSGSPWFSSSSLFFFFCLFCSFPSSLTVFFPCCVVLF